MPRLVALLTAIAVLGFGCKAKNSGANKRSPTTSTPVVGVAVGLPSGVPTGGTSGFCGDAVVDALEECDQGADNAADAPCLSDCTINDDLQVTLTGDDLTTAGVDGIAVDDPAFVGSGSWQATPSEDTNLDGYDKFELYLDPNHESMLMLQGATVADLAALTYATRKAGGANSADFYFVIYTEPDGVDDQALWYGYRLIAEPLYSRGIDAPADTWNTWSLATGPNQLTFFDSHKAGLFGFAGTQPTLGELQANTAFNWADVIYTGEQTAIDYGAETIGLLSIQTGSPWESTFAGNIDDIHLELVNGRKLTVDLEP